MIRSAGESSRGFHRLITLQDCVRKYGFRYGLRLEPQRSTDAPALGSLLHIALMHRHLKAMGTNGADLDPVEAMRRAPARIAHQFSKAVDVWNRYVPWADTEDAAWRILDVEREYEARIEGFRVTARLDLVAEYRGQAIIIDHKSASGELASVIRGYEGTGQMAFEEVLGASVLPEMYGLPFGGVWLNAIGTAGQEPVALRSRLQISRPWRDAVVDALGILLRHAESVESREDFGTDAGTFDLPVSPEACWSRWGRCDYYDLCRDGIDAMPSSFFNFDRGADEATILRESAGR